MTRNILLAAGLVLLVVGGVWLFGGNTPSNENVPPQTQELPPRIAVEGVWECLPHVDTGPTTDECIFGIAGDQSDAHFAVDTMLMSAMVDLQLGERVRVEGVFTPAAALSSDHWQQYPIDGIISATSIQKL